jgi:hypothetical protein
MFIFNFIVVKLKREDKILKNKKKILIFFFLQLKIKGSIGLYNY